MCVRMPYGTHHTHPFFCFFLVGVILAIDKPLHILQSPVVSETP